MKVGELLLFATKEIGEYQARLLLSALLNVGIMEVNLMSETELNKSETGDYVKKVKRIKEGKPIQYVIGHVNFYGNEFKVNEDVLIPRFETEELVYNTLLLINKYFNYPINILDIGTGSGCIGLSLKKRLPNARVTLLDVSPEALLVARENATNLACDATFLESDMWENVRESYDVIISNPPYIRNGEEIEEIVKNNEPSLALFGGEDGLFYYRKIRDNFMHHVKDKFLLALEIGDMQKDAVIKLFSDLPDVEIISKCDLSGRDRMIFVIKNIHNYCE